MIRTDALQPADLIRIAKRRWMWLVAPMGFFAIALAIVALVIPNRYRSETTVLVVPTRVPESYVRTTVTSRIEERVRSLREQILSRPRLERIIDEFGLYAKDRERMSMEQIIDDMRSQIFTRIVRQDAFLIAFTAEDPVTAQRVTARLAAMFAQENFRDREVQASSTNQFLETELDQARTRLSEQEAKVEAFRLANSGELPEQVNANIQTIQNIELQLQVLVQSLASDRERRSGLERQLAELSLTPVATPVTVERSAPVDTSSPLTLQIEQARRNVAELSTRVTPAHPDLISARQALERLERQMPSAPVSATGERTADNTTSPLDIARRRRMDDLAMQIESVNQLIEQKSSEEARLRGSVSGYRMKVELAPRRETELVALTRDYDTLQRQYRGLLEKFEESKVAANLERQQIGEQFRILDPAQVPERPVSPNRPLLVFVGMALGLGIGAAVVLLLEFRDQSFRSASEAVTVLNLPVLATVPDVAGRIVDRGPARRMWGIALGTTAVLAVLVLMIARDPGAPTRLALW